MGRVRGSIGFPFARTHTRKIFKDSAEKPYIIIVSMAAY